MSEEREMITGMEAPVYLDYNFTAGTATSRFLNHLRNGKLVGQECPKCSAVYIPARGSCAACGIATEKEIELVDKGTIQSFTIVYIPIPNNPIKPPFVIANLMLDGAHQSFLHLISECNNDDVRIGMRVQAVWKPEEEWTHAMENIRFFRPLDEPDMPIEDIGRLK
jgi:hypothetical protein